MRWFGTVALAAWLAATEVASGAQAQARQKPEEPLLACCDMHKRHGLTPEQIEKHERDAYAGYATPALLLYRYYRFVAPDAGLARHWLMVGAENGSPQVMVELAEHLMSTFAVADRLRARFWLERARASGEVPWSAKAAELLSRL